MVSIYDHYCVGVSVLTQQVPGSQVGHMDQGGQRPVLLRLRSPEGARHVQFRKVGANVRQEWI